MGIEDTQIKYYNQQYKNKESANLDTKPSEDNYFMLRLLDSLQLDGIKVMEMGCGDGYLTKFLLKRPILELYSVDISDEAIKNMQNNFRDYVDKGVLRLHCSDLITYLEKNEDKYNLIIGSGILHHIEKNNWDRLFNLCYERLNSGGFLVFSPEPNASGPFRFFWKFAGFFYNKVFKIDFNEEAEIGIYDMKTSAILSGLKKALFSDVMILPYKVFPSFRSHLIFQLNKFLNIDGLGKISTYITIKAKK